MTDLTDWLSKDMLCDWVKDARNRSIELVDDLTDQQLRQPPYMSKINPPLWEIAHLTWFQENFVLRDLLGREPVFDDVDRRYNSSVIGHEKRWSTDLFPREKAYEYMRTVRDRIVDFVQHGRPDEEALHRILYTVYHDDMHNEAFTYTRQTLGYPPPDLEGVGNGTIVEGEESIESDDVDVPGGIFPLGASRSEPFVFDLEKWVHQVEVEPFSMARTPVTQGQFAEFVEDGGYRMPSVWSDAGWRWRQANNADHPLYWRRDGNGGWLRRDFDAWTELESNRPVVHVNYYEAKAYCRWADRRLPTEAEWMVAASAEQMEDGDRLTGDKLRYPWGDERREDPPAQLDWRTMTCAGVNAFPDGDSPAGCRQMVGNVWEWTDSDFEPFPGFEPDFYEDNAEPWFGTRNVLKGGAWPTRSRFIRSEYRNYFTPERRDVYAGFRTCASQ